MSFARIERRIAVAALLVAVALARAANGDTISHDERFVDGLRQRGLYELAEKYCTDRLADSQLAADRRATLSIELSRTFADHALRALPDEQAELWRKAKQVVADYATRNPRDPKLVLVQVQAALAVLAEGELARRSAEVAGGAPAELEAARGTLRDAIAALRELDESISAEMQRRPARPRAQAEGQLSVAALSSLDLHVRHELARALRNQALCYPLGSADRINSLGQAIELLAEIMRHEMTPELAWQVRLDAIACLRLVGNYRDAEQQLAQAERAKPPQDVAPGLRAERVRLALARDQVEEAMSEAGPPGATAGAASIEANLAQLEAYLAGWARANERHDKAEADRLEKSAVAQVRAIGRAHGPPYSRLAETLLARSITEAGGTESPQVLLLAAQGLYRSGRVDEAQAVYDKAAERAAAAGDRNAWFDVEYAAAALAQERKDHRGALDRFRKLAAAMPRHPRAADAHLLAVHSAAQLAAEANPPKLDTYEQLLREHIAAWPHTPTASQASWWLGRLKEHQGAWQEAIRALAGVAPDHAEYAEAIAASGRCYQAALDAVRRAGNPNELLAADAVKHFESIFAPPGGRAPAPSAATRAATLAAAHILLMEINGGGVRAQRLLTDALRADPSAPPEWKRQAHALLIPALAADGQLTLANQMLSEMPIGTAAESLALADRLAAVRARAQPNAKRPLAELEMTVLADVLARPEELDPVTQKTIARRRADTLLEIDRRDEAVAILTALAQKYPNDGQSQEDLAQLLAAGGNPDSWRAGLAKWREVATHSRPGSPRWFRAHLAVARLLLELGDPAKARSTIKLVEASHPDFGSAEMKARFRQLLAECER